MKRLPGSHSTEHRGTQTGSVSSPISKAEIKQSQPPHLLLAQDQGDSSNYSSWDQDVGVGADGFLFTGHHFWWLLCVTDWPRSS